MFRFIQHYLAPLFLGIILSVGIVTPALAVNTPRQVIPKPPQVFDNVENPGNPQNLTGDPSGINRNLLNEGPKRILDFIFGTFTTVGTIVCVIAGIRIIFSNGDTKKFQQGIKAIVYSVVGIMIIGGAWMAIRAILSINLGT